MDEACSQKWLNGTYYSLCWLRINVWMLSKCWSQYIFLPTHICPRANMWLLKPRSGIQRSPMTPAGSVKAHTVESSSPMFPWTKGDLQCACEQKPCLSPSLCKLKRPPTLWRKAAHRCQEPCKALPICWVYLGRDANKKPNRTRYTEGVDSVGKWTHLVEGGNGLHRVTWNTQTDLIFFIELPPKCHH